MTKKRKNPSDTSSLSLSSSSSSSLKKRKTTLSEDKKKTEGKKKIDQIIAKLVEKNTERTQRNLLQMLKALDTDPVSDGLQTIPYQTLIICHAISSAICKNNQSILSILLHNFGHLKYQETGNCRELFYLAIDKALELDKVKIVGHLASAKFKMQWLRGGTKGAAIIKKWFKKGNPNRNTLSSTVIMTSQHPTLYAVDKVIQQDKIDVWIRILNISGIEKKPDVLKQFIKRAVQQAVCLKYITVLKKLLKVPQFTNLNDQHRRDIIQKAIETAAVQGKVGSLNHLLDRFGVMKKAPGCTFFQFFLSQLPSLEGNTILKPIEEMLRNFKDHWALQSKSLDEPTKKLAKQQLANLYNHEAIHSKYPTLPSDIYRAVYQVNNESVRSSDQVTPMSLFCMLEQLNSVFALSLVEIDDLRLILSNSENLYLWNYRVLTKKIQFLIKNYENHSRDIPCHMADNFINEYIKKAAGYVLKLIKESSAWGNQRDNESSSSGQNTSGASDGASNYKSLGMKI